MGYGNRQTLIQILGQWNQARQRRAAKNKNYKRDLRVRNGIHECVNYFAKMEAPKNFE